MNIALKASGIDRVRVIRLNQPSLTFLEDDLIAGLGAAIDEVERDDSCRCLVLTGETHFAAGADTNRLRAMRFEKIVARYVELQALLIRLALLAMPVVAVVEGYALGGGLELALAADHPIAGEAARLGPPEVNLGIFSCAACTQLRTQIVGRSRPKKFIKTARTVHSSEPARSGVVDEVVETGAAERPALEFADKVAAGLRWAIRPVKEAVYAAKVIDLRGLALERPLPPGIFATRDARLGLDHFLPKTQGPAAFGGSS